ncbi:MAG: sensor histidine kinase [Spirochaetaceae bacterium]|nr:sensor histidine kinase [Spirochaetaceae bacterium]MDT8297636.1 sensor histidine kinase [Spirochaetaceae bacterium]
MNMKFRDSENELIRIFRFFSGGVALVFMLLQVAPGPLGRIDPAGRRAMFLFSLTYGVIFIYLIVPGLQGLMKSFYLPPVLIAASVIPIAIINAKYRQLMSTGGSINTLDDTMTVTILLIFPLITTAWKYRFSIVFLFFVVMGFLDPLLIILVNESFTPEIYNAFNASLVRILALGAVGFMITELRDRQRYERRQLEEANRKLEDYAKASERLAASRERNRIARELHDTLAHTLSGLAIQLEATETVIDPNNDQLKTMLDRARTTVRDGLGETRRALKAMRSSPLEDLGLTLALGRLADDASGRDDVAVTTDLPVEIPDWDESLEEGVYRIAQEALENIVRHAHASESFIKLTGDMTFLKLEIRDNGRGFYPPHVPDDGRYGIRGMKERAEALGGKITIESQPGKGTHIMFLWGAES